MIDRNIVLGKADRVNQHISRIREKRPEKVEDFISNLDLQESILFNLQMAVQNCIDIASHIISDEELGLPGSTNDMFYMLQDDGYIDFDVAENMVTAVGFRNLLVHEYVKVDLKGVYKISRESIDDLLNFLKAVFRKTGLDK